MKKKFSNEIKMIENAVELTAELRSTSLYKNWSKAIKEANDNKCLCCGSNEKLEAHHTLSFKYYPYLRVDLKNGVCLCDNCHNNYHKEYDLKNTSPFTLIKFIQSFKKD